MDAPLSPDARYAALVEALRELPNVAHATGGKKSFGADALRVDGRIFAMLVGGRLVLKLPRARVDALVTDGQGIRFDPGRGRAMKEWISLTPEAGPDWLPLAGEARAFVGARA